MAIGNLMASQPQVEAINLAYSYDGYWNDILAGIGSTDQTGNYVFPVVPSAAYKGGARTSHYWLAAGGFDTMYTLWNPEPDAQELLVTLKYGANGATYKLPLTLESHASAMIDIGELIWTRQLDQNGNILPADVAQGSLVVSSPANVPEDAIDVVVGMGIYNPTKATCGGGCTCCGGMVSLYVDPFSDVLWYGDTQQYIFGYTDNSGWQYDVSNRSTWTSNASQVIGVQTAGQGSPGLANAVGVGPAEISAYDPIAVPINVGWVCMNGMAPFCPMTQISSSAPVTVAPEIDSISPSTVGVGNPSVTIVLAGSGFGTSPQVNIEQIGTYTGSGNDTSTSVTFSTSGAGAFLGDHDVTVTVNGQTSDAVELTIVCAIPTNFQWTETNLPDGSLLFNYTWSSSTGKQSDLGACTVGESVFYPNYPQPTYQWPLPMVQSSYDPTVLTAPGSYAGALDQNWPPNRFQQPYFAA